MKYIYYHNTDNKRVLFIFQFHEMVKVLKWCELSKIMERRALDIVKNILNHPEMLENRKIELF